MKNLLASLLCLTSLSASAQFITNNGIDIVNTGVVFTNGDWVNQGPIRNNGTIITSEAWTNTGTLDAASTGGFVLQYATTKTFTPGGTSFGFLVKEGAGNADITGVFELKDSLSLKGGLVTPLSTSDVLTVNETAVVSSAPGSFLQGGSLVRRGTGTLRFPVGRDGNALPITVYDVQGANPSITVSLEADPGGYTAGAGVEALVSFPFVWRVTKADVNDAGGYVEVEYPETLTTGVSNPIVMRQIAGNVYQGMGARLISTASGTTRVRSYSRGLDGTYSVGRGFAGNLETDKEALEDLYLFTRGNRPAGNDSSWVNRSNWLSADVTTWQGVTETGGYITGLSLPNNNITGPLPPSFADLGGLQTINLAGNDITSVPDLSGLTGLTTLNLSSNRLGFGSIIPNKDIPGANFSNQQELTLADTSLVDVGTSPVVSISTDGEGNVYQWKRNEVDVAGATGPSYEITSINRSNMGNYRVQVTNPAAPGITLRSGNQRVLATATVSGRLLSTASAPATSGKVTLYRVNPSGAFIVADEESVANDGAYQFEKVVLDDYLLLGAADTLVYANTIPTYYQNTIFWEEADTLLINDNTPGLDIIAQREPTEAPRGQGEIRGVFEDPSIQVPGRTESNKRIANAGASVRRRVNVSRPQAEQLILVAYVYTNEDGVFIFDNLEQGEYLLNLQVPGYPMDQNSFINISIGTGLARNVEVEALIQNNKIAVRKLVVTGWDETEERFKVYPNPASARLHVQVLEGMNDLSYTISSTLGNQVQQGALPFQGLQEIDTDSLADGVYIVELKQGDATLQTFRIVISH